MISVKDLRPGTRVRVAAPEGGSYIDTVRVLTLTHQTVAPHTIVCVVLTERSWCRVGDVLEVLS